MSIVVCIRSWTWDFSVLTCDIFQLDPTIYESIQKEKVEVGDVIYIEANTGSVKVNNINIFVVKSKLHVRI